ncbi:S49 family peptidase [Candidatus Similichlamydia laticola]|uniref:Protease n=1 Tax=Candidatus Similichlamydia laticola TaxID=2170265 RepID=A0A369KGA1_9BACT|nr:S49 family peptidase [Candidatus Similichlamydia laticola]RDB31735.1 Protease [Candidatus Similichlamydia laticola]
MKEWFTSFGCSFSKGIGWILGFSMGCLLIGGALMAVSSMGPLGSGGKYVLQTSSNANGVFLEPSLDTSIFLELSIRGEMNGKNISRKEIEGALNYAIQLAGEKWRGVSALILHVDSPGGFAKEGFDLFDCLEVWKNREQIPVYVFVNGVCASAAFFTSCVADKIFAHTISLIGSIGVISPCFSFGEALERLGVDIRLISAGTGKTDLNFLLPIEEPGVNRRQHLVNEIYELFLNHVAVHRSISVDLLRHDIGARVFLAQEALELGLIDGVVSGRAACLRQIELLHGTSGAAVVRVEKVHTFPSQLDNLLQSWLASPLFSWFALA